MENILSMLLFFPAAAATVGFMIKKESIREYAVVVTFVEFVLSLLMWYFFDPDVAGYQFMVYSDIIPTIGIDYVVGVDGVSLFLIIMLTFITMISVIAMTDKKDMKNLVITLLYLEMTMVGVFVSLNILIFYIFWEMTLIPMFYIIGFWGAEKRFYAAVKFFLYTFMASLVMLIGILYFGYVYHEYTGIWTFNYLNWNTVKLPFDIQIWLFLALFLGFAVKVPMIPFHTWLPLAHGQAPTIGSIALAAVLLKMETYGFIRFSLPLFPDASVYFVWLMAGLGIAAIIYTAMLAYVQKDMKQLIAYSSISHMGVITLGVFALNMEGIAGSVYLMISHGIVSGALFMCVGILYERRHTKLISEFGGLSKSMPLFATLYAIILFASIGLPLTIGFIGEFLSLVGFFKASPIVTFLATLTIILGAIYMLSMYKRAFFGKIDKEENRTLKDIYGRELLALASLVVTVIVFGIYPNLILKPLDGSIQEVIKTMQSKAVKVETKQRLEYLNRKWELK